MYASRLWSRHQENAKDNPTHSLSPMGLLHRFRANQRPPVVWQCPARQARGSEIMNRLIVYYCDKWLKEQ